MINLQKTLNENKKMNGHLRQLRELNALSRKDLAQISGVNESTIYRLENGKSKRAMPRTVRQLAKALKVAPAVLLSEQTGMF
jgi:transcriptional regulator with XRE-family HTH domain